MILFLHGAGERGGSIDNIKINGLPKILEEKEDFPFITVSPLCPDNTAWLFCIESLRHFLRKS
ncbi:hypothetical protein [Clostridium sp.]|uniref:hypothetical protein n=1 Tax=Clostridium sp. TaxID=1506 RepID=UPI00260CEE14|nr:hypothetical protein [uncultured Clostridium sp.]